MDSRPVGAAEGCDLLILIFRLRFKCLGKDRSLVALDSSYTAPTRLLHGSYTAPTRLLQRQLAAQFGQHRRGVRAYPAPQVEGFSRLLGEHAQAIHRHRRPVLTGPTAE